MSYHLSMYQKSISVFSRQNSKDKLVPYLINLFSVFLFFSYYLEPFPFLYVGTFSLNTPTIIIFILLILNLIDSIDYRIPYKKIFIFLFFLLWIITSSIFLNNFLNTKSFFYHLFYLSYFLFYKNYFTSTQIKKIFKVFIYINTILSLYGLYQFIGYNFINLPFLELIPPSLYNQYYNVFATTNIGNMLVHRAHSLFIEPSAFSQIATITILLTLFSSLKHKLPIIIINIIGLCSSLSGTGLFILFPAIFIMLIYKKKIKYLIFIFLLFILFILAINFFSTTPFIRYYIERLNEFSGANQYTSGYFRFYLPFHIFTYSAHNFLFGYGIGNDSLAFLQFNAAETNISTGFFKIIVELGLPGGIFLFLLLFYYLPNAKKSDICLTCFICALLLNFVGGSLLSNLLWVLLVPLSSSNDYFSKQNL